MNNPDFEAYLMEYQAEGVGELLYGLILGTVEHVTKRYPPTVYSPNGIWDDDAISSLCHDFVVEKLLKAGWLEHYLLSLETLAQFQKVLERDFRHFLISRKDMTEFQNLVKRVRRMLHEDSTFRNFSRTKTGELWGLSSWAEKDVIQELEDVVRAMFNISLPPLIRYRTSSKKVSHLISSQDLQRLLDGAFRELDGFVDFSLLIDALRYRLNLFDVEIVSLNEPLKDDSSTYADIVSAEDQKHSIDLPEIARQIIEQLSERQKRVLGLYFALDEPTLEQIGTRLGISKSTVSNDLRTVEKCVASADVTEAEAESLFARLSEFCASYPDKV